MEQKARKIQRYNMLSCLHHSKLALFHFIFPVFQILRLSRTPRKDLFQIRSSGNPAFSVEKDIWQHGATRVGKSSKNVGPIPQSFARARNPGNQFRPNYFNEPIFGSGIGHFIIYM